MRREMENIGWFKNSDKSNERRRNRGEREKKEERRDYSSIEHMGMISIHPFHELSYVPHQLSPLSLFTVLQRPPSILSSDSSSSQRRSAELSLGPRCHARGHRRFLREIVPAASARQSSPLVTTLSANDAPGERIIPSLERLVISIFFALTIFVQLNTFFQEGEISIFFLLFFSSCSRNIPLRFLWTLFSSSNVKKFEISVVLFVWKDSERLTKVAIH